MIPLHESLKPSVLFIFICGIYEAKTLVLIRLDLLRPSFLICFGKMAQHDSNIVDWVEKPQIKKKKKMTNLKECEF